jgi:hypothetical protein
MNAWLIVALVTLLLAPYLQIVARAYLSVRPYAILDSQQRVIDRPFWADTSTAREINEMCDNGRLGGLRRISWAQAWQHRGTHKRTKELS